MIITPGSSNGKDATLDIAIDYLRAGRCAIPICRDGSKKPTVPWKAYESERPTEAQAREWWGRPHPPGIAVLCGRVSANAELMDFDREAATIFPAWRELVDAEAPGLVDRLTIHRTPRPGYQAWYRCLTINIPGNQKLASLSAAEVAAERELAKTEGRKAELTLIETRGEGGYALVPGCPPDCHSTGRAYEHVGGPPLTELANISPEEREVLFRCAQSFDREADDEPAVPRTSSGGMRATAYTAGAGLRPGDDFDLRADWEVDVLGPHGWAKVRETDGVSYWARPGKDDKGWSATTGRCKGKNGEELFKVFSSSADPFQPGKPYGKFRAFALLNHGGDLSAAAKELRRRGYGDQRQERNGPAASHAPDQKPPPGTVEQESPSKGQYAFETISSQVFFTTDYRLEWLVQRQLVRNQPAILGGPRKCLKTSILMDLAVSLASATPFLGHFKTYRRVRVVMLSGESGEAVLKQTGQRICAARGIDPTGLDIEWGFRLPQVANALDRDELRRGLEALQADVVLIDPLYLCLLAGVDARDIEASNLFQMGPLLSDVAHACLDIGATPVLAHHARKNLVKGEPMELEDLAFSGIQEFARQWVLINRREKFDAEAGTNKLWLSVGGSAGQCGAWAIDVAEGRIGDDFGGRTWDVVVRPASEARVEQAEQGDQKKAEKNQAQNKADEVKVLGMIDKLTSAIARAKAGWRPPTKNQIGTKAGLSDARTERALDRLDEEGIIHSVVIEILCGTGLKTKRRVTAYLRAGHDFATADGAAKKEGRKKTKPTTRLPDESG